VTEEICAIVQHPRFRRTIGALAAGSLALLVACPAAAQTFELDGTLNLGYTATTNQTVTRDPTESPSHTSSWLFTEVRPGVSLQLETPRLSWRIGYVFAGSFSLDGAGPNTYSNAATLSLMALLTNRSTMTVSAIATQGGTAFQLSQRAPEAGNPEIRAPGDPNRVTLGLAESFVWAASSHVRLGQGLTGTLSAPQDDLGQASTQVAGYLSLDRVFPNDAIGGQLLSSVARLQPLSPDGQPFWNVTNSLLGRWNHTFSWRWNGQLTAGVQQVVTLSGSYPLSIVPTSSGTVQYLAGNALGSLAISQGATTDLQTGTVSMTEQASLHGLVSFDALRPRLLGASAGFLHSEPLGAAAVRTATGTGNAVQADVGLVWGLSDGIIATARYSLAYQFGQGSGVQPSLAHVFLLGVTARYSTGRYTPPIPTLGRRGDGSDAIGFPGNDLRGP
jgi:hypothetical protein